MADECEDQIGIESDEPCNNKDVVNVVNNLAMEALEKGKKITKLEKKLNAETIAGKIKMLFLVFSIVAIVVVVEFS
jgi:hypothetical protein